MRRLREQIAMAAPTNGRVLISGENGTGKELVARQMHALSHRRAGPFVEVNCAAIPEELIESELFGHTQGRVHRRRRAIGAASSRLADGGTLFLDEVGDMSLKTQAKVLRALQEQVIEPVGGQRSVRVDVRVIAATNKDLARGDPARPVPRGPVLPAERHSRSSCRRCASAATTSCGWPSTSSRSSPREYGRRRKQLSPERAGAADAHTAGRATCASCAT